MSMSWKDERTDPFIIAWFRDNVGIDPVSGAFVDDYDDDVFVLGDYDYDDDDDD